MKTKCLLSISLMLFAAGWNGAGLAASRDLLQLLPSQWQAELAPVPDTAQGSGLDDSAREKIYHTRLQVVQALQQAAISRHDLASAYAKLGAYYLHYSIYTLAEQSYANAAKLDPLDFRWIYYLAFIAHQAGQPEIALQRYFRARELDSRYPPLDIRVADLYLDLNQLSAAQESYQRAARIKEFAAPAEHGLGQIALLQRDYPAAIEHFEKELQHDPDATQTHYPLAQAYRALKQNERARQHLLQHAKGKAEIDDPLIKTIKNLEQGANVHFSRAVSAVNQGRFDDALKAFAAGLELDPDNAAAHVSYARTLYISGHSNSRVSKELQRAIHLDRNNTLALFLLGVLAEADAKGSQAISYYRRIVEIDPEHAGAHFYLARYLFDKQDYTAACPHVARTITLEPMNLDAQLKYLSCLEIQDQSDAVLYAQLETLQQRFPDVALIRFLQLHLLALSKDRQLRDTRKALAIARQLAKAQPVPPHLEALALVEAANDNRQADTLPIIDKWFAPELFAEHSPIDYAAPFRYYPAPRPY